MQDLVQPYFEIASKIFGAANETLASVDFNLAARAANLVRLAEIYDGYSIKREVCQATAKSLKSPKFLNSIYFCMMADQALKQGNDANSDTMGACKAIAFKACVTHLNKNKPDWKWVDFAKICSLPPKDQAKLLKPVLNSDEQTLLSSGFHDLWEKTCSAIVHYAEDWDRLEAQPKISIREWLKSDKAERGVLLLRPSEGEPELTRDYIAGILNYANQVILDELPDSKTRRMQVIIDELASLGNLQRFLAPAQEMYRSKGVGITLIFQDFSQAKKIYGQEFLSFMQSNTANCFFLGAQPGETTETISKVIGDRTISITPEQAITAAQLMRPQYEEPMKGLIGSDYDKLKPNEKAVLAYHAYKVGPAGAAKYKNLIGNIKQYLKSPSPELSRKVAEGFTYSYMLNGERRYDTRSQVYMSALWLDPQAYGFLLGNNAAPADFKQTAHVFAQKVDPSKPVDSQVKDELEDAKAKLYEKGIVPKIVLEGPAPAKPSEPSKGVPAAWY